MARKAFVATDAMREQVRHLAGIGVPQDDIAAVIGCAPKTLRKCFRANSIAVGQRLMRQSPVICLLRRKGAMSRRRSFG